MNSMPWLRAARDPWVALGLFVSAVSAAVSSFAGLHALALDTGWPPWAAPLFPLTVDCYAMTSVRVWLSRSTGTERARRFARANAFGAILLSVLGNGAWHLIRQGWWRLPGWWSYWSGRFHRSYSDLVVHLAVLRTQNDGDGRTDEAVPQRIPVGLRYGSSAVPSPDWTAQVPAEFRSRNERTAQGTGSQSSDSPRYASKEEMLEAARRADAMHRSQYGKPITRDALRRSLHISSQRATEALRRLKEERAS